MPIPAGYNFSHLAALWNQTDGSGPYFLDAAGNAQLFGTGNVATATADSGNPVKIGGRVNSGISLFANGNRADLQMSLRGAAFVQQVNSVSTARLLSAAASTNATNVKANPGKVYKIILTVAAAADKFLKLYNNAGVPNVGVDVPILTLTLPASTKSHTIALDGHIFTLGIGYAITGAAADADATALAAGDITNLNITYD